MSNIFKSIRVTEIFSIWYTGYKRNVVSLIFKKNFPSPKMAAILNFRIFAKNGKTQNCLYLLNRAR